MNCEQYYIMLSQTHFFLEGNKNREKFSRMSKGASHVSYLCTILCHFCSINIVSSVFTLKIPKIKKKHFKYLDDVLKKNKVLNVAYIMLSTVAALLI